MKFCSHSKYIDFGYQENTFLIDRKVRGKMKYRAGIGDIRAERA